MKFQRGFGGEMWNILAREEPRYNLMNFYLDAEVSMLAATDGHACIVVPVTVEDGEMSGLVPRSAIRRLIRGRRRMAVLHAGEEIVLTYGDGELIRYKRPAGQFPRYREIMRQQDGPLTISIDAYRLAALADALGARYGQVNLWIGGPREAVIVNANQDTGAFAVLMPCRSKAENAPRLPQPKETEEPVSA